MNYNEYDSNGNKKSFNFNDMITDKKQRSRLILGVYAIIFLMLIIFVRMGTSATTNNGEKGKNTKEVVENKELDIYDEMFSLIDGNNYNFLYQLNYSNELYEASGKRYNNKY